MNLMFLALSIFDYAVDAYYAGNLLEAVYVYFEFFIIPLIPVIASIGIGYVGYRVVRKWLSRAK